MITLREGKEEDVPAILKIYNYSIVHSNATFDLDPKSLKERKEWFSHYGGKYPLIVAENNGEVIGYCCLSPFRSKPAYTNSVEVSIYIANNQQGKGVGKLLLSDIIKRAREIGHHTIIAGISDDTGRSASLHQRMGFEFVGRFKEVGYKFGQWQDVSFYQLLLK